MALQSQYLGYELFKYWLGIRKLYYSMRKFHAISNHQNVYYILPNGSKKFIFSTTEKQLDATSTGIQFG